MVRLPGAVYARDRATIVSLVFALVMTVLTFQFWWEAWENNWVSDSTWRSRL